MQPRLLLDHEYAVSRSGFVVRALVRLEGRVPDDDGSRVPLDLSLVLDRSGSMAGPKLAAACDAAALLVRRLRPEDVVSVVAYDDEVQTVAWPATGEGQGDLPGRILGIRPGGTTNLSGGWLRAHELVSGEKRRRAGRRNDAEGGRAGDDATMHRILLLTDGLANVGITEPDLLVGLCRRARAAGITTSTIGFGEDYDEHLLRAMADAGGGNAYYIERPDQAPGVFEEEIDGLLTLSAQNVTVEVRPTDAAELTMVHHDYPAAEHDGVLRLELGDVYAREPRALLCEFFVPSLDDGGVVEIAEVTVTAHVLTAGGGVERQEVRLPIAGPLGREGHREPEVRREMLLLEAARARQSALRARERGDFAGGAAMIAAAMPRLADAAAEDETLREEVEDLRAMSELFEHGQVSAADAKYMAQRAYNVHRKRGSYQEKLSRRRKDPS